MPRGAQAGALGQTGGVDGEGDEGVFKRQGIYVYLRNYLDHEDLFCTVLLCILATSS